MWPATDGSQEPTRRSGLPDAEMFSPRRSSPALATPRGIVSPRRPWYPYASRSSVSMTAGYVGLESESASGRSSRSVVVGTATQARMVARTRSNGSARGAQPTLPARRAYTPSSHETGEPTVSRPIMTSASTEAAGIWETSEGLAMATSSTGSGPRVAGSRTGWVPTLTSSSVSLASFTILLRGNASSRAFLAREQVTPTQPMARQTSVMAASADSVSTAWRSRAPGWRSA